MIPRTPSNNALLRRSAGPSVPDTPQGKTGQLEYPVSEDPQGQSGTPRILETPLPPPVRQLFSTPQKSRPQTTAPCSSQNDGCQTPSFHTPPRGGGTGRHPVPEASPSPSQTPNMENLVVFASHKSGMDRVDRDRVNRVIYKASRRSAYFQKAAKQAEEIKKRCRSLERRLREKLRAPFSSITSLAVSARGDSSAEGSESPADEDSGSGAAADLLQALDDAVSADLDFQERLRRWTEDELEKGLDLTRWWIHIDMDSFYAAVEIRDNPQLRGLPMAVGNLSMICTTSYEARSYGVRSAMPGFIGRQLCPQLVFVPPNFAKYRAVAKTVREVFEEFDPDYSARSLDEAALDVTDWLREHPEVSPTELAQTIRDRIYRVTGGLTASAGIGVNQMLAKIASDMNKPNGQFLVPSESPEEIRDFLSPMKVRKIPGIGLVTQAVLNHFGIFTCQELTSARGAFLLEHIFRPDTARWLRSTALGIAANRHAQTRHERFQKSVAQSQSFPAMCGNRALLDKCEELSLKLWKALPHAQPPVIGGHTLTLSLKSPSFETRSRSVTSKTPISSLAELHATAEKLLRREIRKAALRHYDKYPESRPTPPPSAPMASPFQPQSPDEERMQPMTSSVDEGKYLRIRLMGLSLSKLLYKQQQQQPRSVDDPSDSTSIQRLFESYEPGEGDDEDEGEELKFSSEAQARCSSGENAPTDVQQQLTSIFPLQGWTEVQEELEKDREGEEQKASIPSLFASHLLDLSTEDEESDFSESDDGGIVRDKDEASARKQAIRRIFGDFEDPEVPEGQKPESGDGEYRLPEVQEEQKQKQDANPPSSSEFQTRFEDVEELSVSPFCPLTASPRQEQQGSVPKDVDEISSFSCPVCEKTLQCSLPQFNTHLDCCLARQERNALRPSQPAAQKVGNSRGRPKRKRQSPIARESASQRRKLAQTSLLSSVMNSTKSPAAGVQDLQSYRRKLNDVFAIDD